MQEKWLDNIMEMERSNMLPMQIIFVDVDANADDHDAGDDANNAND